MTDEWISTFLARKCAEIIAALSELYGLSLEEATDMFYRSDTAEMIEEGIADLHCRSAKYLAQCVHDEFSETSRTNS